MYVFVCDNVLYVCVYVCMTAGNYICLYVCAHMCVDKYACVIACVHVRARVCE